MEYEIYYLCNLLGVTIIVLIILFHFVNADKNNSNSWEKESKAKNKEDINEEKTVKKHDKVKTKTKK